MYHVPYIRQLCQLGIVFQSVFCSGDSVKCPVSTSSGMRLTLQILYHSIIGDPASLTPEKGKAITRFYRYQAANRV